MTSNRRLIGEVYVLGFLSLLTPNVAFAIRTGDLDDALLRSAVVNDTPWADQRSGSGPSSPNLSANQAVRIAMKVLRSGLLATPADRVVWIDARVADCSDCTDRSTAKHVYRVKGSGTIQPAATMALATSMPQRRVLSRSESAYQVLVTFPVNQIPMSDISLPRHGPADFVEFRLTVSRRARGRRGKGPKIYTAKQRDRRSVRDIAANSGRQSHRKGRDQRHSPFARHISGQQHRSPPRHLPLRPHFAPTRRTDLDVTGSGSVRKRSAKFSIGSSWSG